MLKFPTHYTLETSGIMYYSIYLTDAISLIYLCIVYTVKFSFTCKYPKLKQPYAGGIITKESCYM